MGPSGSRDAGQEPSQLHRLSINEGSLGDSPQFFASSPATLDLPFGIPDLRQLQVKMMWMAHLSQKLLAFRREPQRVLGVLLFSLAHLDMAVVMEFRGRS